MLMIILRPHLSAINGAMACPMAPPAKYMPLVADNRPVALCRVSSRMYSIKDGWPVKKSVWSLSQLTFEVKVKVKVKGKRSITECGRDDRGCIAIGAGSNASKAENPDRMPVQASSLAFLLEGTLHGVTDASCGGGPAE